MRATPRIYLGTMTFSWSQTSSKVDESVAVDMIKAFVAHNEKYASEDKEHMIDTARIYAGGKTETTLGAVLPEMMEGTRKSLSIGSKAHPSQENGLSVLGIQAQLDASLEAMKLDSVGEYYLHQPDTENALIDSLKCLDGLMSKGTISCIGMSNYHVDEVQRAFELCDQHNLTPPTVYQGLYNPLNRLVEDKLLPLLKQRNCKFVAYNPLAAGLLTGKHRDPEKAMKGRFKDNQNYLPRFYTEPNFEAVEVIRTACTKNDISLVEATYRWLLCHSKLTKNDGVLIGASSMQQLSENLAGCGMAHEEGSLPPEIVEAFDQAWEITREAEPFPYWRSYSADMPDRETRDQGASYSASKK